MAKPTFTEELLRLSTQIVLEEDLDCLRFIVTSKVGTDQHGKDAKGMFAHLVKEKFLSQNNIDILYEALTLMGRILLRSKFLKNIGYRESYKPKRSVISAFTRMLIKVRHTLTVTGTELGNLVYCYKNSEIGAGIVTCENSAYAVLQYLLDKVLVANDKESLDTFARFLGAATCVQGKQHVLKYLKDNPDLPQRVALQSTQEGSRHNVGDNASDSSDGGPASYIANQSITQAAPQMSMYQQPQPRQQQQQPYSKTTRPRKVITIVDPTTNKDITDLIIGKGSKGTISPQQSLSATSSTSPMSTTTPPPQPAQVDSNQAIQAQFAAKLAMILDADGTDNSQVKESKRKNQKKRIQEFYRKPQPRQQQQQPYSKATRPRKVITVVDPTTNKDITDLIIGVGSKGTISPQQSLSATSSTPPMSTATPPPQPAQVDSNQAIQAQFAAKLAMIPDADGTDNSQVKESKRKNQKKRIQEFYRKPQPRQQQQQPYSKATRPRKVITVVDPTTNKDITDLIIGEGSKGTISPQQSLSATSSTPPMLFSTQYCSPIGPSPQDLNQAMQAQFTHAQFAAEVARRAMLPEDEGKREESQPPVVVSRPKSILPRQEQQRIVFQTATIQPVAQVVAPVEPSLDKPAPTIENQNIAVEPTKTDTKAKHIQVEEETSKPAEVVQEVKSVTSNQEVSVDNALATVSQEGVPGVIPAVPTDRQEEHVQQEPVQQEPVPPAMIPDADGTDNSQVKESKRKNQKKRIQEFYRKPQPRQQQQQPYSKATRPRKVITVVDPTTNKDITDLIIGEGSKGTISPQQSLSATSSTPPMLFSTQYCSPIGPSPQDLNQAMQAQFTHAQFAAEVARRAMLPEDEGKREESQPPVVVSRPKSILPRREQQRIVFQTATIQPVAQVVAPVEPSLDKPAPTIENQNIAVEPTKTDTKAKHIQVEEETSKPAEVVEEVKSVTSNQEVSVDNALATVPQEGVPGVIPAVLPTDSQEEHVQQEPVQQEPVPSAMIPDADGTDNSQGQVPLEVLARGPEANKAFVDAMQGGSKCIYQTRLMLVGPERVGKTSLTKALTEQEFDATEEVTDGIETLLSCTLSVKHITNWKPKPTEGKINVAKQQYLRAVAERIASKLLQKKHEEHSEIQAFGPKFHTVQINLFSVEDEIKKLESVEFTKDIDSPASIITVDAPMRASSQEDLCLPTTPDVPEDVIQLVLEILQKKEKRGENGELEEVVDDLTLSIWDFAGQDLYYITHQVFLVSRAIYIICFNLCHDLNAPAKVEIYKRESGKISVSEHHMNNLDFIIFWLQSIYSNTTENPASNQEQLSPPVFIVGTHFLSLPGNAQERLALVEEKFAAIQKKIKGTPFEPHVVSKYYAIDNSLRSPLDQSIVDLRDHITKVAKLQHYMGERIPIKWLKFLHEIEQLCKKQKHSINFKEVKELADKCGIIKEIHLFTLLHFYHDLGNIVYYGEHDTPDSALNDIVILNPNWLICIFRKVFTVKGQSEQWAKFKSSWARLDEEGLLEEKLIRHMWHDYLDQLEGLLQLMEKFDLLCVKTQSAEMPTLVGSPEEGNRFFYVPSLLKKQSDQMDDLVTSKSVVMLYIDFNGFLPEGLFYRLLVRLVQWSQSKGGEPRLFYQNAILYVDEDHNMILRIMPQKRSYIQVAIMRASSVGSDEDEEDEAELSPGICKMVLTLLYKNLTNLGRTWMKRIDFGFCILCSVCDNKEMTHFHELKKCLEKKRVQCEMKRMKTTRFQRLFGDCKSEQVGFGDHASSSHQQPIPGLSWEDFLQLLEVVSSWWKRHGNVNMLKVLLSEFKDNIPLAQIEEKNEPCDLFRLLRGPGLISPSDIDVVIEAADLGGLHGVQQIIKEKMPTFPGLSNIVIRKFSKHRQNLIRFGRNISNVKKERIGQWYDLTSDQLEDQWVLIFELEKKGVLTAENKKLFIQRLEQNEMKHEADILK